MSTDWKTTMKPSFLVELNALPAKEMQQVMAKIQTLVEDPRPDGHMRMQLKYIGHRLHRLRCGNYRVFYTFETPFISLLALRRRQNDTYDGSLNEEHLSGFDPDIPTIGNFITSPISYVSEDQADPAEQKLPKPITSELLKNLRIPAQYHSALLAIQSEEELLECPDVPGYWLTRLLDHLLPPKETPITSLLPRTTEVLADPVEQKLPKLITSELLKNLGIPTQYHSALLAIQSEEELLECSSVPQDWLTRLFEYQFPRSLQETLQEPDLMLNQVNDLARFKEGELLGFLLKLSNDQKKYVQWALHAHGPALLRGGPGTGKSTIALYRVHELVQELRRQGRRNFRILFATYTEALMRSSQQLLRQLLGQESSYVDVKTTDAIARSLLEEVNALPRLATEKDIEYCLEQGIKKTHFEGTRGEQQAQRQAIDRLSRTYLEQEIHQVIIARQLSSVEEYLRAVRPGRRVGLNRIQRIAVWSVYETYLAALGFCGCVTLQQLRAKAEQYAARGRISRRYDAVIIDEAQDLDASALRMLIHLCLRPDRLFITADANQSVYGSGFNWNDVHDTLRVQGRTAILHTNYRSTHQIGEAALSYLGDGVLEQEANKQNYIHLGTRPFVCVATSSEHEVELLKDFLTISTRELRFSPGSCAILCPTKPAGEWIAQTLSSMRLPATFMDARDVDLEQPGVKVMLLKSAKGLEFPIVAIAGFPQSKSHAVSVGNDISRQDGDSQREHEEALALDRRSMYVGMTRAMRALLVIVPANIQIPLLTGFDPKYWDRV